MVKVINSLSDFQKEIQGPGLVVVDFYADWCGPCKMIAPVLEQLSQKYQMVKFLKVNVDNSQDIAQLCRVQAMPTFIFYKGAIVVDTLKGANAGTLEAKINQHKVEVDPFAGQGFKLTPAGSGAGLEAGMSSREARLKAFGHFDAKKPGGTESAPALDNSSSKGTSISKMIVDDEDDEALAQAIAASMASESKTINVEASLSETVSATNRSADEEGGKDDMVPVPVNQGILSELIEMGFSDVRSRKAIIHGKDLEGALAWLDAHQDDPDIDQPYLVRREDAENEAKRSQPLTEEEKAKKILEYQEKVKRLRAEREAKEKEENIKREKDRIEIK